MSVMTMVVAVATAFAGGAGIGALAAVLIHHGRCDRLQDEAHSEGWDACHAHMEAMGWGLGDWDGAPSGTVPVPDTAPTLRVVTGWDASLSMQPQAACSGSIDNDNLPPPDQGKHQRRMRGRHRRPTLAARIARRRRQDTSPGQAAAAAA